MPIESLRDIQRAGTSAFLSGGSASITAVTVTVPYGTGDALVNVVDAAVTGSSKVALIAGACVQTDANDPSDAYFSVETVNAGNFDVRARASGPESIGGPFKLFYILG